MILRGGLFLIELATVLSYLFHVVQAESLPSYQRIKVAGSGDIDRLYPIISAYAQDPALAGSVTEIAIDSSRWRSPCFFSCDLNKKIAETEPSSPIRDAAHRALEKHVRSLNLGQDTTTAIIRALEWKKRSILGAWEGPKNEMEKRNAEFGSAAITILLSLCNNISTLYLGALPYDSPVRDYILKSNYKKTPTPALQKLTKVELLEGIGGYDDERMYDSVEFLDIFQFFHRLPSIESIVMEGVQEYQADRGRFVPRTGNMKKIHIGHADIPSNSLATIFSIPKALEEIHLSLGGRWSTDGGHPFVIPFEVGTALRQHQATLKSLDLDLDYAIWSHHCPERFHGDDNNDDDENSGDEWDEYERMAYGEDYLQSDMDIQATATPEDKTIIRRESGCNIGSLSRFDAMTKLSVSVRALMGTSSPDNRDRLAARTDFRLIEILPPNLEYLRLYGYVRGENLDIDEHIDELLALKAQRRPKLSVIEGIDVNIPSMGDLYSDTTPEDNLWERPETAIGWKETDAPAIEEIRSRDEL